MDLALTPLIFLAFFLVGEWACCRAGLEFKGLGERVVFSTSLGHVAFSLASALLVFTRLAHPEAFWLLLAAALLSRPARLLGIGRSAAAGLRGLAGAGLKGPGAWPTLLLFILIALAALKAATPPVAVDALVYHLAVPKAYLEAGGHVLLPNNLYSFYPLQVEMLFLLGLALGGGELAQSLGLGLALLLLLALYVFSRARSGPRVAVVAPLLFFTTPTFFNVATSAYIDVQLAAFLFLGFYAWSLWRERGHDGWFLLMAVFTGAAFATKLTGVIALPLAFIGLLFAAREQNDLPWLAKRTALLAALSLLFILPWWARNYVFTGNPFAPFFMHLFGGEQAINWDTERAALLMHYLKLFGMGHGLKDFLLLPWNLTAHAADHSLRFDGQIGIAYLLLLPLLLLAGRSALPLAVMFFTLLVFWFMQTQQIRMLAPALAFLSLLLTMGLARLFEPPAAVLGRRLALGLLIVALGFNSHLILKSWLKAAPLAYLAGRETHEAFLARQISSYPMYQAMNEKLAPSARVMFVYMQNLGFLAERRFMSDTFHEAHTLQTLLAKDASPGGLLRQFEERGITDILLNDAYVFGKNAALKPAEGRAFRTFLEQHAKRVAAKNGYSLYHFVVD